MMPLQRTGLLRTGMKQVVKWTAEGAVKGVTRVFCDAKARVSCRGYVGIPQSENQGGTASRNYSPLTEGIFCQGLFY